MLYHRRSPDFHGDVLYPLNRLKDVSPQRYDQHRAKYAGREHLMQQRVPPLNCLWNDVIHFSPVHPALVAKLARENDLFWREADWFEIDPAQMSFDAANTAVFLYRHPTTADTIPDDEFKPFDLARLMGMSRIPQQTRDYYGSAEKGGRNYFIFAGIPHVLHRGALNVAGTVTVRA